MPYFPPPPRRASGVPMLIAMYALVLAAILFCVFDWSDVGYLLRVLLARVTR